VGQLLGAPPPSYLLRLPLFRESTRFFGFISLIYIFRTVQ
jgi:hypothetical protein